MKTVDLYIGTSIRGPGRRDGKVCYILKTVTNGGRDYESCPAMAAYDDTTESQLVLYAVRDALNRFNYACEIIIHTESDYIASAFTNGWIYEWSTKGWKTSRDREVKDSCLWSGILQEIDENGHEVSVQSGKHEYSEWMHWNLEFKKPLRNTFTEMKETV